MFFRLSLLTLLVVAGLQAADVSIQTDVLAKTNTKKIFNVGITGNFKDKVSPSDSVDLGRKTIDSIDAFVSGPLGIFPLSWGGMVAKNAKTWKQVGKHTVAAAVYAAFFAAYGASRHPDARLKAAGTEMEAMARLYFSGMFTTYFHSALYNYIDKGDLPVWMQKSLAKAKAYRKAHPAAQQPDEAA